MPKYLVRMARDITITEYTDIEVEADHRMEAVWLAEGIIGADELGELHWREGDTDSSSGLYPVSAEEVPNE